MEQKKKRVSPKSEDSNSKKTVKRHTVRPVRSPMPSAEEIASCISRQNRKKTAWTTFGLIACLSLGIVGMEIQKHKKENIPNLSSVKPLVILSDQPHIDNRGLPTRSIPKNHVDDSYQVRTLLEDNRQQANKIKELAQELEQAQLQLEDAQNHLVKSTAETHNAKIVQMGRNLRKKELSNQNLQKQLRRLEHDLAESQKKVFEAEMSLDGMMAVVDDVANNKNYNELKDELDHQRTVYHEEMNVLERKIAKQHDQAHTLESKLVEARAENDILEQDVWHYEALLNTKEDEITKIKEEWAAAESKMYDQMSNLVATIEIEQTITSGLEKELAATIAHQDYTLNEHLALLDERDSLEKLCTELSADSYELDIAKELLSQEQNRTLALGDQLERALKDYGDRANECDILAKELGNAQDKINELAHYEDEMEAFKLSQARLVAQIEDLSNSLEVELLAKNKVREQLKDVLAKRDVNADFFLDLQQQLADSQHRAEQAEKALYDRSDDLEHLLEAYSLGASDEQIETLTAALSKVHTLETEVEHAKYGENELSHVLAEREAEIAEMMKEALISQEDYQLHLDAMALQLEDEKEANNQLKEEIENLIATRDEKQSHIHKLQKQLQVFTDEAETTQLELLAERADLLDQLESMQAKTMEITYLKEDLQKAIALNEFADGNIAEVQHELEKTLDIVAANEQRIEELEQKLNYMGGKAADTLASLRQKEKEVEASNAYIHDFTTLLASKEHELEESLAVNADLGIELNKLENFKNLSLVKVEELKNQTLAAEKLASEARTELSVAQNELMALQSSYQNAKSDLANQVEVLKTNLDQEKNYRYAIVKQFDDVQACRENERIFIREMEDRTLRSEEVMALAQAELKNKVDELALVKDKMTFNEAKALQLEEQLQVAIAERDQSNSRIDQLDAELYALKTSMEQTEDMLVISDTELESLEKSYRQTQEELRSERDQLYASLEKEASNCEQLQARLKRVAGEKKEYQVRVEDLQGFVADLEIKGNIREAELLAQLEVMERNYRENLDYEQDHSREVIDTLAERLNDAVARQDESQLLAESLRSHLLEKEEELLVARAEIEGLSESCRIVEESATDLEKDLISNIQSKESEIVSLTKTLEEQLVLNDRERDYIKELKGKLKQVEEDRIFEQCKLIAEQEQVKMDMEVAILDARQHGHALTVELEDAQVKQAETQRQLEALRAELFAAQEKIEEYNDELARSETEIEGVQRSYGNAKKDLIAKNKELTAQLHEESTLAKELKDALAAVEVDNSSLKAQCSNLEQELLETETAAAHAETELVAKYEELKQELNRVVQSEQEMQSRLHEVMANNSDSQEYLNEMSNELASAYSELNATQESLAAVQSEMDHLHERYKKANSSLCDRNDELVAIIEEGNQRAQQLQAAIATLEEQNTLLLSVNSETEYKLSDLQEDASQREIALMASHQDLQHELEKAYHEQNDLKERLMQSLASEGTTQEYLELIVQERTAVNAELEETRGHLQATQSELESLHGRYKKANFDLAMVNEELQDKLQYQTAKASELEQAIASYEEQTQSLQLQYAEIERELVDNDSDAKERYHNLLAKHDNELNLMQQQLATVQHELSQTTESYELAQENLENLHARYKKANKALSEKNEELVAHLQEKESLANQLGSKLQGVIAESQIEKQSLYEERQQEVQNIREQYDAILAENEQNSQQIEMLRVELNEAHDFINKAQNELDMTKHQLMESRDHFEKRNENLVAELENKEREFSSLQHKIDSLLEQQDKDKAYASEMEAKLQQEIRAAEKERDSLILELQEIEEIMSSGF